MNSRGMRVNGCKGALKISFSEEKRGKKYRIQLALSFSFPSWHMAGVKLSPLSHFFVWATLALFVSAQKEV